MRLLLHHFPDPKTVFEACIRVLKPGGQLIANEVDAFLGIWYPPDPVMQEFQDFCLFLQQRVGIDPYLGRKLFSMFREYGMQDIHVHLIPDLMIGEPEPANLENVQILMQNWKELLAEHFGSNNSPDFVGRLLAYLQRDDIMTCSNLFLTGGRKPNS